VLELPPGDPAAAASGGAAGPGEGAPVAEATDEPCSWAELDVGKPEGGLSREHQAVLRSRAVSPAVAKARGYKSSPAIDAGSAYSRGIWGKTALMIPVRKHDGTVAYQVARPDVPRAPEGKTVKYENPRRCRICLDVPFPCRAVLQDPAVALFITEGPIKADALASAGYCVIAVSGVWGWKRRESPTAESLPLPDFDAFPLAGRVVYIVFDSDMMTKEGVRLACQRLAAFLTERGAAVHVVELPDDAEGDKRGVDDYLAAEGAEALQQLIDAAPRWEKPASEKQEGPEVEEEEVDEIDELREPLGLFGKTVLAACQNRVKVTQKYKLVGGKRKELDPPNVWYEDRVTIYAWDGGKVEPVPGDRQNPVPASVGGVRVGLSRLLPKLAPTRKALQRFDTGERAVAASVFGRMFRLVQHFLDLSAAPGGSLLSGLVLTAWALATWWVRPAGLVASYLHLLGGAGTSKTKGLDVLKPLVFCGEVANSSSSTAALRDATGAGATLLIDESEGLGIKGGDPDRRGLILGGTRPEACWAYKTPAKRGRGYETAHVQIHGARAFASIRPLDDVLGSRTVAVPLVQSRGPQARRDPCIDDDWPDGETARDLRDAITLWAIESLPGAQNWYRRARSDLPLFGRAAEPWLPLMAVCLAVDDAAGGGNRAGMLARAIDAYRHDDGAGENEDREVLAAIADLVARGEFRPKDDGLCELVTKRIAHHMIVELGEDPDDSGVKKRAQQVGRALKRLRVGKKGFKHGGGTVYRARPEILRQRFEDYGVEEG